jgi:hypothetical protein
MSAPLVISVGLVGPIIAFASVITGRRGVGSAEGRRLRPCCKSTVNE